MPAGPISLISGPQPAALTDTFANPTASAIYALSGVWNGTTWERGTSANEAAGTAGTGLAGAGLLAWDGTNFQKMGGIVGDAGQNAQLAAGSRKEVTFTTTTAQALAATDVSNYRWVSIHTPSQGTGSVVNFQISNDNVNWVPMVLDSATSTGTTGGQTTSSSTSAIFHGPVVARYFRVNVTGITAGTTSGSIEFFAFPAALNSMAVNATLSTLTPLGDANVNTHASVAPQFFNGTNYDRLRGALAGTVLASAARTATINADITNYNWRGVRVVLNVTAASGTGGLQVQIRGKDSISGSYYQMNSTPPAVQATGIYTYDLYPGLGPSGSIITQSTNSVLPRTFNVQVAHGDVTSYTYSVSYEAIL